MSAEVDGSISGNTVKTFDVPRTIEQAVTSANLLGELAFAATWKRAAIVRAFCEKEPTRGRKGDRTKSSAISMREFTRLGVVGLKSQGFSASILRCVGLDGPIRSTAR